MRSLQLIHTVVTVALFVLVLGFGLLALTGVLEVRFRTNKRAVEQTQEASADAPVASVAMAKARLIVVKGAKPGMEYPIYNGLNIIGRADEKPVEIDLTVQEFPDRIWSSRQHAVIDLNGNELTIEDLNSTNGTFVNRDRIIPGKAKQLKMNDIIQIGGMQFRVGV